MTKINILAIVSLMIVAFYSDMAMCGGHHHVVKIDVPYKIHTIHHHHVKKVPVIKEIKVPVIKEVKVPYPVKVPIKVPYPVIVKPHIVTVQHHHKPEHTEEHKHHHESHGHGHGY